MIFDMLKAALARFIESRTDEVVTEVTDFESDKRETGGCETCAYSYTVIEVTYSTAERRGRLFEYEGQFTDLIDELDRLSEQMKPL